MYKTCYYWAISISVADGFCPTSYLVIFRYQTPLSQSVKLFVMSWIQFVLYIASRKACKFLKCSICFYCIRWDMICNCVMWGCITSIHCMGLSNHLRYVKPLVQRIYEYVGRWNVWVIVFHYGQKEIPSSDYSTCTNFRQPSLSAADVGPHQRKL